MKIRTIKLREAHKVSNGLESFCSILWDLQGQHIVTASSSDPAICVHDALLPSDSPKILRNHRDGVTALAISPNSTCLASCSIDHSVKLYKFPGGEFETNITRFTLPIRTIAFNISGTLLAAAGDDDGIKLINTIDGSIARVLKGHRGSVTGVAFDPKSEYLASVDSLGTVIFWELQSGRTIHTLKGIAPSIGMDISLANVLSWSPDGELLAVPGLKNDVVMYDRDTAEKLFSLRGDHVLPICFLSWSPNGKYMATSGMDKQVMIWDIDRKQDIDRQKYNDRISCMAWKPCGNALAVIDVAGKYGVWESAVPSSMKSPTEDIPDLHTKNNGFLLFDEDKEEPSASGSLSDLGEDSHDESEPSNRKRLRKYSKYDDFLEEDMDDVEDILPKTKSHKKPSHGSKDKDGVRSSIAVTGQRMQEAFQPGATNLQPGKRRFLCYNMIGCITSMEHDGYSHIEIDFHDTGSGPRVPAMTDYFGFTMAALNESGSAFANPRKDEKSTSTLMYRPFSSWASNSEWSMRFEAEEVRAVALGCAWVAAVTSHNFLRIFTSGGLQRHIISLDGPIVTAVGFKDELAVVTHASPSFPSNEQVLEFRLFNMSSAIQTLKGRLPLTPGSHLTWFGFSDDGQLSSFDSKGVLRVFIDQYGGSWIPLFSASRLKKPDENYWVVGLNTSKLFCVVCKSPDLFPQASPKPVLSLLELSFPLASSDLGAEGLENEFMMNKLHLLQIQKKIEMLGATGQDTTSLDDDAFDLEAALDRCILRLIASCCNGDKLVRATELVKLLSLEKSVKGAIKLVTALKLPNLAERFNDILEERLMNEMKENTSTPVENSSCLAVPYKQSAPAECSKVSEPAVPALPQKSLFFPMTSKLRPEDSSRDRNENPVLNGTANSDLNLEPPRSVKEGKNAKDGKKDGEVKKVGETNVTMEMKNGKEMKNNGQVKNVGEVNQLNRPSNPFAKASNNQQNTSLFDSLKKMKPDLTGKR